MGRFALGRRLLTLASSLMMGRPPPSTVHIIGDAYLDVIAKIRELPRWDGDTSIYDPIETVAGGSALNTAVQMQALLDSRRQRPEPGGRRSPIRRCVLHSLIGSDVYGDLIATQLRAAGVTLSAPRVGAQGVCICLSGARDRAFVSYKGSVAALQASDLDLRALLAPGATHVHFAAFIDCAGLQRDVPRLVQRATELGATTSLVPQSDAGEGGRSLLQPISDPVLWGAQWC